MWVVFSETKVKVNCQMKSESEMVDKSELKF